MKKIFFYFIFISLFSNAQTLNKIDSSKLDDEDSLVINSGKNDSLKIYKPTIKDYLLLKQFGEKKILDTALTTNKSYIYTQYNNQDNFGKIQFANIGAGFNPLIYEYSSKKNLALLPYNKSYNIKSPEEIVYYDVKTPTTSFILHNAMRNGAALNTTYTQNIGKNFNFALEYMGLRSQGFYRNSLTANNNTIFSAHYNSPNSKYEIFAHFIHQNVNASEYGGIVEDKLYQEGNPDMKNKVNLQVNLQNAFSKFWIRRYYFTHQFTPFDEKKYPFRVRHTFSNQNNEYLFGQSALEPYYYTNTNQLNDGYGLDTSKFSKNMSNTVTVVMDYPTFKLEAGIKHQLIQMGTTDKVPVNSVFEQVDYRENRLGAVGNLEIDLWKKIALKSSVEYSLGKTFGNLFSTSNRINFEPIKGYWIDAHLNFQSAVPSFNYYLNSSIYKKFNFNVTEFKNQNISQLGGAIHLKWFRSRLFLDYFRIDNYTYFDESAIPRQSTTAVNISQLGGEATFGYNKFFAHTQLLFQKTLTNESLYPAPAVVGRLNLFYKNNVFRKAAELQTGIKVSYFSKFASREYLPVYNEFILPSQNSFSIGGIPIVDLYANLKVKRMIVFLDLQNAINIITPNVSYTLPHYPLYDWRLNVGIVWHLIN